MTDRGPRVGLALDFRDVDAAEDVAPVVAYLDTVAGTDAARAYRRRILDVLALGPGDHALEIGCGTGESVRAAAARVGARGRVVGVDLSAALIGEAAARGAGQTPLVELQVGDAHALPFASASFDVIWAERTFQHLADPRRALGEAARVARAGARVLLAEPDWGTLVIDGDDHRVTRAVVEFQCRRIRNGHIGRQLLGLFRDAELTEVRVSAETMVATDLPLADAVFQLRDTARAAARAGAITEAEASHLIGALEERASTGRFVACITGFVVAGRIAR